MGKMIILSIVLCILMLFAVHTLVKLVIRTKKAGKGNWTFRVSWKDAVGSGIKILFWLAAMLYFANKMYSMYNEYIELKYWLPIIVFVLVEIIDFIDGSIETKEAEEKNP